MRLLSSVVPDEIHDSLPVWSDAASHFGIPNNFLTRHAVEASMSCSHAHSLNAHVAILQRPHTLMRYACWTAGMQKRLAREAALP